MTVGCLVVMVVLLAAVTGAVVLILRAPHLGAAHDRRTSSVTRSDDRSGRTLVIVNTVICLGLALIVVAWASL